MSKYTDEEVNRILSDTGELAADVSGAEKFDLEDILAEFGPGSAAPKAPPETQAAESPEPKAEEAPISPAEPEAAAEPAPAEPAPAEPAPPEPAAEAVEASEEPEEPGGQAEPVPQERLVSIEDVMDRTVSAVMEEESAQRQLELAQEEAAARKAKRAALRRARLTLFPYTTLFRSNTTYFYNKRVVLERKSVV